MLALSNTEYARMKRDHEKFVYRCEKCANVDDTLPPSLSSLPAQSQQPAPRRGRGRPRKTVQSQPLLTTATTSGQSQPANVGRKRRGIVM